MITYLIGLVDEVRPVKNTNRQTGEITQTLEVTVTPLTILRATRSKILKFYVCLLRSVKNGKLSKTNLSEFPIALFLRVKGVIFL